MQSGSYGDSPENQINWALSGFDMILYPPDVFNSASTTSAAVDTTAEITSTGISKQFFVQSYAEFRTDTNGYLGRFDGWIMVTIQGE
jgi:S-formylglutathione hydrolase FrmB